MSVASSEIVENLVKVTEEIIALVEHENQVIIEKDYKSLKKIISEKYNLMKKYDELSISFGAIVEELKSSNQDAIAEVSEITKKLNEVCDKNYMLLSKEQEIAIDVVNGIKETVKKQGQKENIVSAKV